MEYFVSEFALLLQLLKRLPLELIELKITLPTGEVIRLE